MGYLKRHEARDNQRAFHQITSRENRHPEYGKLFQGISGIELFGSNLGSFYGTYPDKLNDILQSRIESVTDQDSEWYSQLMYGSDSYRRQLIQHMANEFEMNDIPNLISDDIEYLPVIDDLDSRQLLIKHILPLDIEWTILSYILSVEFDEKARDGLKIDLASPNDIERWSKKNDPSFEIQYERALVLTYIVPTTNADEIEDSMESVSTAFEYDVDWIKSLLEHFRGARDKHRKELIRGVAEAVAKKVDIYSKVYAQLESVQIPESSVQQKREPRSGRIFKPWLVDVHGCICAGCNRIFCYDQLEVDHVVPWETVKTTKFENLQLLCGHCNRLKANGSMDEFLRKLDEQGGPMNDACCDGNH